MLVAYQTDARYQHCELLGRRNDRPTTGDENACAHSNIAAVDGQRSDLTRASARSVIETAPNRRRKWTHGMRCYLGGLHTRHQRGVPYITFSPNRKFVVY